jgi:DNA-binding XRE family transcriptional regulator
VRREPYKTRGPVVGGREILAAMTPADRTRSSARTRLAQARLAAEFKQAQLAEATGLSPKTIQKLDRGEIDNPPIRYLVGCAHVLGVELVDVCEPEWLRFTRFGS